jgi:dTDP-glucose pyrophosphorylase
VLGIVPAAGVGSRIQPLAFSKELLPVGSRSDAGVERPRAVSEYLIERLIVAGATRICFVISPGKSDIVQYFGGAVSGVPICYTIQDRPAGLCDALFRALPFAGEEESIAVGLPDTVWFPVEGLQALPHDVMSFLLFPVAKPELFDAVVTDDSGVVTQIDVKARNARSSWVWGAFKIPHRVTIELRALWDARDRTDEYLGTLINAYLAGGGRAVGVRAGTSYVDVGTLHGYREALRILGGQP